MGLLSRLFPLWETRYRLYLRLLAPLNYACAILLRRRVHPNSALHISYSVHIPFHATRLLRQLGMKADYLAIGASPLWNEFDYRKIDAPSAWGRAWQEFRMLWGVVARYEIVHMHFVIGLSYEGWELPFLKKLGRRIVIHYRGCEIRNREKNMALHPTVNICQKCDYNATICRSPLNQHRRELARRYGDVFLVTTPDLRDFAPEAEHLPFFAPAVASPAAASGGRPAGRPFRIVHVTGHPGIEGTDEIREVIERLRARNYQIDFIFLRDVAHEKVLAAFRGADLAIGKMKMGYYANAQVESMTLGVPTVTYVRPEFITDELRESGLILTNLDELEKTLEYYISNPDELAKKRSVARDSILRIHDGEKISRRLIAIYDRLRNPSRR